MSDDEGRLLIDDIQDGSGSVDHDFSNNVLVDVKSAQGCLSSAPSLGDAENTSINKLSTPLTVPVFGQPQVTSSAELHFHTGAPAAQRMETTSFSFASNLTKLHAEQETSSTANISPSKHKKKFQLDGSPSLFAQRSDIHSLVSTPRSSTATSEPSGPQGDNSVSAKRQKRYKANGVSKARNEGPPPRKRKDSSLDEQNVPESDSDETVTKKLKPTKDRGTCVHSRAVQSDSDSSFFDLEVGSTRLVEMTVVCKMENNELYVTVKWKDQEMSGVLTDGRSPAYYPYMKKRQAIISSGSNSSNNSASGEANERASNSGASTPSKYRQQPGTPRESKKRCMPSDAKRKLSCSTTRPGSSTEPQDDDEEMDAESNAGGSSSNADTFKLFEVAGRKSMHICPYEGCQHRYPRGEEMEYHKATVHAKRAIMYEAICCQTDISALRRRSVQTDVEGLASEEPSCPPAVVEVAAKQESANKAAGGGTKVEDPQPSKSPAGYSDISDDGIAPQLQKEEPTNDVRASLLIATTAPSSSAAGPTAILVSPDFAQDPKDREIHESLPSTPQQPRVSRPSSMPIAPATPTAPQSSFQPVSADRNRVTVNGTGVSPVVNSIGTPTSVSAISASTRLPVTPAPAGMYMSSFAHQMISPFTPTQLSTPAANPAPSPQQQSLSKLSHTHLKPVDECTPASGGVLSATKTMQSPAAQSMQRQFGLPMMQSGTGQHQAAMMQAAAAQAQMAQMHHLYMQQMAVGARGAQFPMAGTSTSAQEMAQFVALQALQQQQQNHFASMFQQK